MSRMFRTYSIYTGNEVAGQYQKYYYSRMRSIERTLNPLTQFTDLHDLSFLILSF